MRLQRANWKEAFIAALTLMTFGPAVFLVSGATDTAQAAADISHAAVLYKPIVCVGNAEPDAVQTEALKAIVENMKKQGVEPNVALLEKFLTDYPTSEWVPSLQANLGRWYYEHGHYTRALEDWQDSWKATKDATQGPAKQVADFTFAYWTHLLATLGRMDTLQALYKYTRGRVLDDNALQLIADQGKGGLEMMRTQPAICFRCGTYALANVGHALNGPEFNVKAAEICKMDSPLEGFSMTRLVEVARTNNLDLVPAQWSSDHEIVVPSVVHWKVNHYVAVVQKKSDRYLTLDPTFGKQRWLLAADIQDEASGDFLVPRSELPQTWRILSTSETDHIFGRGFATGANDGEDGCGNGSGGSSGSSCSSCGATCPTCPQQSGDGKNGGNNNASNGGSNNSGNGGNNNQSIGGLLTGEPSGGTAGVAAIGMPYWNVSEPYINVWLYDEPISYQPGLGYPISLRLSYKQRESRTISTNFFSFGNLWDCSWLGYIEDTTPGYTATMLAPGGGERDYTPDNATIEFYSHTVLQRNTDGSGNLTGFTVSYSDGCKDYYSFVPSELLDASKVAFLSKRVDAFGHAVQFVYQDTNNTVFLRYIIDGDGRTNHLYYTNSANPNFVTDVQGAFSNNVTLSCSSTGALTNIVDPVNIKSAFAYGSEGQITNLNTPYGLTTFQYVTNTISGSDFGEGWYPYRLVRCVKIVDPENGTNIYMLRQDSTILFTNADDFTNFTDFNNDLNNGNYDWGIAFSYDPSIVPSGVPTPTVDNAYLHDMDSFHWGPKQADGLPQDVTVFNMSHLLRAHMKHWLHSIEGVADTYIGQCVDMEQDPSPDGVNPGQTTWYDYDNKVSNDIQGSESLPSLVARVNPDGQTWYVWYRRDQYGRATNVVETYSTAFGVTPSLRTNVYNYAANGIDLVSHIGPTGSIDDGYRYDSSHNVTYYTNAVGYVTVNTYDTQGRLTKVQTPAGLTTTYNYPTGVPYSNWVQSAIETPVNITNSYTYSNDLVYTHTDPLNNTTSFTYDGLDRVLTETDPRGTIYYTYTNLDLIQVKDRMGFVTSYLYDGDRREIAMTNALTNFMLFNYCPCGSLESVQDLGGFLTRFDYDNAGRLLSAVYPDGYTVYNEYDLTGRITNRTDGAGVSTTNWYNAQGLLYAVSNSFGLARLAAFDIKDRPTNRVDNNGVVTKSTYDNLDRLLTRSYPDTGTEHFAYSAAGLISYGNQLNYTNYYGYDAAARRTALTNANGWTNKYVYDGAGDLTNLVDGKGNPVTWTYDAYGRPISKVDTLGTNFIWQYDADNRLTSRWTPQKLSTAYAYDSAGNLTNVAYHASPSLKFGYNNGNRLISMSDAIGTTTWTYASNVWLQSEAGPWASDTVSYTVANRLRQSLSLQQPNGSPWSQSYAYANNRLSSIASPAGTFSYSYNSGVGGYASSSALVSKIALPTGAAITNGFDNNGRMTATALVNGVTALDYFAYTYDLANERTAIARGAISNNTVQYAYDKIGEVVGDHASDGAYDGSLVRQNEQIGYAYDNAGNLAYRTNNTAAASPLLEHLSVNPVNELTSQTNTGKLTVVGTTTSSATNVAVNGTSAAFYGDATFAASGMPISNSYTAIAHDAYSRWSTNVAKVSLTNYSAFQYDLNGNLTSDGLRNFVYDDENQLTEVLVTNQWMSQFQYDGKMRRRVRKEFTWTNTTWTQTNLIYYVYDGNLVIQERDQNNLPNVTYTRGNDLSGSLQKAGGIGGLLARTDDALSQTAYYHTDGNGNVTMLINSSNAVVAKYLYDAFGNILSQSGSLAAGNLYRFSSKEAHPPSGLNYYLYRYYDANLQRWPTKDPIFDIGNIVYDQQSLSQALRYALEERRHPNAFWFVGNSPVTKVDFLGLQLPPEGMEALEEAQEALAPVEEAAEAEAEQAAEALEQKIANLMQKAREMYPKLCGKIHRHHPIPKYLGGDPDQPLVALEAPYHQLITNAFRDAAPYGEPPPPPDVVQNIVNTVYSQYPLPQK